MRPESPGALLVYLLIDRAEELLERLSKRELSEWRQTSTETGDRLIPGPDGKLYLARYSASIFVQPGGTRIVWFTLESHIPHMSSIVACIGISPNPVRTALVVNLNYKQQFGSLGAIVGLRGDWLPEEASILLVPPDKPSPLIEKDLPAGFRGMRSVFTATESTVAWNMRLAETTIAGWINAILRFEPPLTAEGREVASEATSNNSLSVYLDQMRCLHGDGGVFDAVFGDGWVSATFLRNVFGELT